MLRPQAPALDDLRDVQRLFSGHSGAIITLHGSGAQAYVRKQSADIAHNERLLLQAEKQRLLFAHGMAIPRILGEGVGQDGLAYFDMEYAPGRTVANAVIEAAPFDRDGFLRNLGNLLWLFRLRQGDALSSALFHAKIEEIVKRCGTHIHTSRLMPEVQACGAKLQACAWDGVPESPCHGDLTLENILLSRNQGVVFIDCDTPFVSSWWLDAAKLFQDIQGHWCIRTLYDMPRATQFVNAVQKLDWLGTGLRPLIADEALSAMLPQLTALNLFRCLPYVRDEAVGKFVCGRIHHVLAT